MGFSNIFGVPHWGETTAGRAPAAIIDGRALAARVREEVAPRR
jgi:hypothetical protein